MAVTIGLNWPAAHDNTAVAIVDGRVVFASEEERFTRKKHSPGSLPENALTQVFRHLKKMGIAPKDVDAYAVNYDHRLWDMHSSMTFFITSLSDVMKKGRGGYLNKMNVLGLALNKFDYVGLLKPFIRYVINKVGEAQPEDINVFQVEHHLAHASSAYYFSGFDSAAIVTADGAGEKDGTTIWKVKNGEFEKVLSLPAAHGSIGTSYECVCWKLGYDTLSGPGKVMGLAPYGKKNDSIYSKLESMVELDNKDAPYRFTEEPFALADKLAGDGVKWDHNGKINPRAADIAWAMQNMTERMMLATTKWAADSTGEKNLCLAGGVALNAKANMEVYYSKQFNDLFICPAANDSGSAMGAAAYVHEHFVGQKMKRTRMKNIYLGPEYSEEEIKKVVERGKWHAEYIGDDTGEVSRMVAKKKIITWYQGRAELGPRALGNRSIVADPRNKDTWARVNKIKGREWWRPMAPSLLSENKSKYFIDPTDHEFMVLMFRMSDYGARELPAVCHVDRTARPQTVTKQESRNWYNMIKAFEEESGEGLVVNTSFNLAGEPLVETPSDAIRSFALGGFDALYLQGWLIKR